MKKKLFVDELNKEKEMLKVVLLMIFRIFVSKSKDGFQVKLKQKKENNYCLFLYLNYFKAARERDNTIFP